MNYISVKLLPKKVSLASFTIHWRFIETVARSIVYNLAQRNFFSREEYFITGI